MYALSNGVVELPIAVVPAVDNILPVVPLPIVNSLMYPFANTFEPEPKSTVSVVVGIESLPAWNISLPATLAPSEPKLPKLML